MFYDRQASEGFLFLPLLCFGVALLDRPLFLINLFCHTALRWRSVM